MSRASGYYTLAFFAPISALVMTTWISFWISPSHPAAKLSLLVPPLIIILGIIFLIHFSVIPWISYITALTIYTYLSLGMVLLAFVPLGNGNGVRRSCIILIYVGCFGFKKRWTNTMFFMTNDDYWTSTNRSPITMGPSWGRFKFVLRSC